MTRDGVVRRVADLIAIRSGERPLRVAVDGVDAAGKTQFADHLGLVVAELGIPVMRASVDGFHRPAAERYRRESEDPAVSYYEDSFDYDRLRSDLLHPLSPGGSRRIRTEVFDVHRDSQVESPEQVVAEDVVVVVDGVFLMRSELRDHFDLTIFLDVDFSESVARAVERDRHHLGSSERASRRYEVRYVPGQRLYLGEAQPFDRADVVIDNNDYARPVILRFPNGQETFE